MARYFLAFGMTEEVCLFWRAVRAELQAADITCLNHAPPHATVLAPRELSATDAHEAIARSERLKASMHALYAEPKPITCFPTAPNQRAAVFYVPFVGIGVDESFQRIVTAMQEGLPPEPLEGKTLHLTVAEVPISQQSLSRYKCEFYEPPAFARLDHLVWYRQENRGERWEEVALLRLEPVYENV